MRFLFFILLASASAFGAIRTASVSGDWNNTATWGGNPVPVSGDQVTFNDGISVTIPSGVAAASNYILLYGSGTGQATLTVLGTLAIDSGAYIAMGAGSSRDGNLILGPSSSISLPELDVRNGRLYTTNTTASTPATITGGFIGQGIANTKHIIDLRHCKLLCGSNQALTFGLGGTTGAVPASSLYLQNCVFKGWGGATGIKFGNSSTPNTVSMIVTNCDFQEWAGGVKNVDFERVQGGSAAFQFVHNTMSLTPVSPPTSLSLRALTSSNLIVSDNVFHNTIIRTTTGSSVLATNNFFTLMMAFADNNVPSVFVGNYLSPVIDNAGGINMTTASTVGAGTHWIVGNVMEGQSGSGIFTDKPDFLLPAVTSAQIICSNNLLIGSCELAVGHGIPTPSFANGFIIKNNTIAGKTQPDGSIAGHLWVTEGPNTGTGIVMANNLHRGNSVLTEQAITGSSSGAAQVIDSSNYNAFWNTDSPYEPGAQLTITAGNTTKTVPGANDLETDPQFVDDTRDLATWDDTYGSGTGTQSAAITHLLALNGYRGSPNYDQQGTAAANGVSHLVTWVRAGYYSTNPLLATAGDPADGSPPIGIGYTATASTVGLAAPLPGRGFGF